LRGLRDIWRRSHVVVIGGGAVGASTAFWLRTLAPDRRVTVIERDGAYTFASTPRSVGGVRVQFTCGENVRLSHFGSEFVANSDSNLGTGVGFRPSGYLFLATSAGEASLRRAQAIQQLAGATVELLSPDALAAAYPWLCIDGLALGARGKGEGAFDPHLFLMALRSAAKDKGAHWVDGSVVRLDRGRGCQSANEVRRVALEQPGDCNHRSGL
jgi:FAD-dependent oxidoreductase domain-containing protein 1